MCKREDAIEKIKKLLALADGNANEHEAVAAALKAQKLIAEWDVETSELADGEQDRQPVEIETEAFAGKRWRGFLASAVADNFRCKVFTRTTRSGGRVRHRKSIFVGYPHDANAAKLTYEMLARVGEQLASRERAERGRQGGSAAGVWNEFLFGFVEGVRTELEKQARALLLVRPREVESYYEGLDLARGRKVRLIVADDEDLRARGEAAGKDAVRSRRLAQGAGLLLDGD